jgi:hypothetical protein
MMPAARRIGLRTAAACLLVPVAVAASATRYTHRDAPPPGHTGGFGEPTCQDCHFQADVNDGAGAVAATGLPHSYEPGGRYRLTVVLAQPGLGVGGFQVAARFEDGTQAGCFTIPDREASRTAVTSDLGIEYAHHLFEGTAAGGADSVAWELDWIAPDASRAVVFHVVANAGNGDDSPLGDYVYTARIEVRPSNPTAPVRRH